MDDVCGSSVLIVDDAPEELRLLAAVLERAQRGSFFLVGTTCGGRSAAERKRRD